MPGPRSLTSIATRSTATIDDHPELRGDLVERILKRDRHERPILAALQRPQDPVATRVHHGTSARFRRCIGIGPMIEQELHHLGLVQINRVPQSQPDRRPVFRQIRIRRRALDERHVRDFGLLGPLLRAREEIVEDVLRDYLAGGTHTAAQEGQHVSDSRAHIGNGHAGLQPHGAHQFAGLLFFVARGVRQADWLDAPFELCWRRIAGDETRPFARERESARRLYEERREFYELADCRVEMGEGADVKTVAAEIGKIIRSRIE